MALTDAKQRPVHRRRPSSKPSGRRVEALATNAGLTPNDLAYRAGISGNTVRLAMAGFRPRARVQFAIAQVFDLLPLDIWPLEDRR